MQWTIDAPSYFWCDAAQRLRLERYGFQFGAFNQQGQTRLVGPVTVNQYGCEEVVVVVEVTTLEAMHTLLDALGVVCLDMETEPKFSGDLPDTFSMTPVRAEATTGRPLTREEVGT
jgi:hypothetical protein